MISITKLIKEEVRYWVENLLQNIPGRSGILLRRWYWRKRFYICGHLTLMPASIITSPKNISIGSKVTIMHHCCLYAHNEGLIKIGDRSGLNHNVLVGASDNGKIIIGNDVLVGSNVVMRASNHRTGRKDMPINTQGHTGGSIIIKDDVWIGANAVILSNVTIGTGAVIGAGAVVCKDIPAYSLAVGVPANVIREDFRSENKNI